MATCDDCVLGPNLSQATKAAVGIIPSENAEAEEMRNWHVLRGDIREDVSIGQEIVEFIKEHGALSVVMTDGIIGCPTRKGSITTGNGALFVSSGVDAIALRADASLIRTASGRSILVRILQQRSPRF